MFSIEHEIYDIDIEALFSGCMFHFGQSALRKKRNVRDQNLFSQFIHTIKQSTEKEEMEKTFHNLKHSVNGAKGWCEWWLQEHPFNMLWRCLNQKDLNTNNDIESLHSRFEPKPTAVQEFRQISQRYLNLYDQLAFIFSGHQFRYTQMTKKRRDYIRKRKRIVRQLGRINKSREPKQNAEKSDNEREATSSNINGENGATNYCTDSGGNSSCDEEDQEEKSPSESKIWTMIQNGDCNLGKRNRKKKKFD